MSSKKNKGKFNIQPSTSRHVQFPDNEEKKEKKVIKFQVPSPTEQLSDESFHSAISQLSFSERRHVSLITDQKVNISVLSKYLNAPVREVTPRPIIKTCNQTPTDLESKRVYSTASSNKLFEIVYSNSPVHEANWDLICATYLRKLRAVKKAISHGANVNTLLEKETPLMIATEIGDARLVAYLLTVPEIDPDFPNCFGHTPLIVAVGNGFDAIVKLLLKHNADVNLSDNMGKTPLHCALFQQRLGLVKLLLAFGADYEKSDCFGEKPMYTASVKKPNLECLKTLLKMGAAPDFHTVSGISLLSRTIISGTEFKIIETLVKYGASVNFQDKISKKTPLHSAALMDNVRVAELLVNEGADINMKTTYNFTPLDEASVQKSEEVKLYLTDLEKRQQGSTDYDS